MVHTLWHTPDRGRFFLLPAEAAPPPGGLLLFSRDRAHSADPAAVARYEVSHADAREWLDAQLARVAADTRRAVADGLRRWWDGLAAPPTPPPQPSPDYIKTATLLARLTRRDPDELLADPDGVETAFRALAAAAERVVAAAASDDPEQIVAAGKLTAHYRTVLAAEGIDLGDGFADAPLRLRRWFRTLDADARLADAADRLCAWADRLEAAEPPANPPEEPAVPDPARARDDARAVALAQYNQNCEQVRHHDALRERTTSMVAQTVGVMLGLIGFKEGQWQGSPVGTLAAAFVMLLGGWGLFSAVLSENRVRRHLARINDGLSGLVPDFVPKPTTGRTQWVWYLFHAGVVLFGLLLLGVVRGWV